MADASLQGEPVTAKPRDAAQVPTSLMPKPWAPAAIGAATSARPATKRVKEGLCNSNFRGECMGRGDRGFGANALKIPSAGTTAANILRGTSGRDARLPRWHGSRPRNLRLPPSIVMTATMPARLTVVGARTRESDRVLTPEALAFVERLHVEFGDRRRALLEARQQR